MDDLRILVVSPGAARTAAQLCNLCREYRVVAVADPDDLEPAVSDRPRFDAVVVDVTWSDTLRQWDFDGLDVLDLFDRHRRSSPVIAVFRDRFVEADHLSEVLDRRLHPDVVALASKSEALTGLPRLIEAAANGRPVAIPDPPVLPALHHYFDKGRGQTAGRLAAAVASGRANRYESLAEVAQVAHETAAKLVSYLEPIITVRGECPPGEPLTQAGVYRWCGEHAPYLLSWHRRRYPTNPISRWIPPSPAG